MLRLQISWAVLYCGSMGIKEKKMETTRMGHIGFRGGFSPFAVCVQICIYTVLEKYKISTLLRRAMRKIRRNAYVHTSPLLSVYIHVYSYTGYIKTSPRSGGRSGNIQKTYRCVYRNNKAAVQIFSALL